MDDFPVVLEQMHFFLCLSIQILRTLELTKSFKNLFQQTKESTQQIADAVTNCVRQRQVKQEQAKPLNLVRTVIVVRRCAVVLALRWGRRNSNAL